MELVLNKENYKLYLLKAYQRVRVCKSLRVSYSTDRDYKITISRDKEGVFFKVLEYNASSDRYNKEVMIYQLTDQYNHELVSHCKGCYNKPMINRAMKYLEDHHKEVFFKKSNFDIDALFNTSSELV